MPFRDVLLASLRRSSSVYSAFVAAIPESALDAKLPGLRSNRIGQQLWCVVGARESYARAIQGGKWAGFSCSLTAEQCRKQEGLATALETSAAALLAAIEGPDTFTDAQFQLIIDVVEHEAAHQGQLIRYLYALDLPIPESWKKRYALD